MDPDAASAALTLSIDSGPAFFIGDIVGRPGRDIVVPVTVAFGDRDWILTKRSQRRNELPAHTQWLQVRGWGHVPTWLDPTGVSRLILESTK